MNRRRSWFLREDGGGGYSLSIYKADGGDRKVEDCDEGVGELANRNGSTARSCSSFLREVCSLECNRQGYQSFDPRWQRLYER